MIAILDFLGTNCQYDTEFAYKKLGFKTKIIWHEEKKLPSQTKLVVIPGGFSYGDYLRSGAIAKFANIMSDVKRYAQNKGLILGICNGFQILLELKLLPGAMKHNENLNFISKYHHIKVVSNDNTFLKAYKKDDILDIPIAHGEGNYFIDDMGLKSLEENNQILFRYCDEKANSLNPNGSISDIAGICNKEKNIFALMPHPERAIDKLIGSDDGVGLLKGFFD